MGGVETLNIYTCNPGRFLGWATFPKDASRKLTNDGVVSLYSTVPATARQHAPPLIGRFD